jgi:hypothetical protein
VQRVDGAAQVDAANNHQPAPQAASPYPSEADGQCLAGVASTDLPGVNPIDNPGAISFTLHGDDLLYAGLRQQLLPFTPLHFELYFPRSP